MNRIYESILETIGNTPVVQLNRLARDVAATVLVKCEFFNPAGCVKERIGLAMIEAAERAGLLGPGGHVVEPTSGNTGIGLAMVCAVRGYDITLVMPESLSVERRKILQAFGARLELTPAKGGMKAAIARAQELADQDDKIYLPMQFRNEANPAAHRTTTGPEILAATGGRLDAFVAGVGTGGTLTGTGESLKRQLGNDVKIVAVEPAGSPVLSGGTPGSHRIQGIGAGFVPEVLNVALIDEIVQVRDEDAMRTARRLAREEGIFCGISSGAATWAALEVARDYDAGQTVLALLPDTGERYLSTDLWSL